MFGTLRSHLNHMASLFVFPELQSFQLALESLYSRKAFEQSVFISCAYLYLATIRDQISSIPFKNHHFYLSVTDLHFQPSFPTPPYALKTTTNISCPSEKGKHKSFSHAFPCSKICEKYVKSSWKHKQLSYLPLSHDCTRCYRERCGYVVHHEEF